MPLEESNLDNWPMTNTKNSHILLSDSLTQYLTLILCIKNIWSCIKFFLISTATLMKLVEIKMVCRAMNKSLYNWK